MLKGIAIAGLVAWLTACATSLTVDVVLYVGDEQYRGTSTGYTDRTGTADLISESGKRCIGQFRYTGARTGVAIISCDDGQRGQLIFNAVTNASGYGNGATDRGIPIQFSYGPDYASAARHLSATRPAPPPPQKDTARSAGTGFYVSPDGRVVTNAHVIDRCARIALIRDGVEPVAATVVAKDLKLDLAILQSSSRPRAWVQLRTELPPRLGESITVFGFPVGGALAPGGTVTAGIISAITGPGGDTTQMQITAPIQLGSSGSPVFDNSGRVVGVVVAMANARSFVQGTGALPQNVNFAISAPTLGTFLAANNVALARATSVAAQTPSDIAAGAIKTVVLIACE